MKYNALKKYVPRGTWLDYGAGAGDFVQYISRKNIDIIGLEPNHTAREAAKKDGIQLKDTASLDNITPESQACITLWHVLEHIQDFHAVLASLISKLQPKGILVLALPNHLSYDAQIYQNHWAALDVPRHLWHFTEKDITAIASQYQLEFIETKGMILDSFYASLLSEKYQSGSRIRGITNGLLSNLKARYRSHPYSSQIYILRK